MKLYELQARVEELLSLGDEILEDGIVKDLIEEVGYNLITIENEDGVIAEGYRLEDFTEDQLNIDLALCSTDVYTDEDGYTCVKIYLA